MVGFFERMMITKQLKFSDGRIELFDRRFAISGEFISNHIGEINSIPEAVAKIYRSSKDASCLFFIEVGSKYKFSFNDFINWELDVNKFCGWGVMKYEKIDKDEKIIVVSVLDSPTGIFMKGKTALACDHITRGFIAGGAKAAFNDEIECLEIECIAKGDLRCLFVAARSDELKLKYQKIYERQVGNTI